MTSIYTLLTADKAMAAYKKDLCSRKAKVYSKILYKKAQCQHHAIKVVSQALVHYEVEISSFQEQ